MIYTCEGCNRTLVTKATEALETGEFPPVVSYCAVLRDDVNGSPFYCCADCGEPRPGKFEGNGDRNGRGIAQILYSWSMSSSEDDIMTSEGWGYCGRFGKFLLMEDSQGFVTYSDEGSEEAAEKEFSRLYAEGWGADEDDAYISPQGYGRKPYVSFGSKE